MTINPIVMDVKGVSDKAVSDKGTNDKGTSDKGLGVITPQTYLEQNRNIVKGALSKIYELISDNRVAIETYGIGNLYGAKSKFSGIPTDTGMQRPEKTEERKKIEIELEQQFGKDEAKRIIEQMKEVSCSGFLLDALRAGFWTAGLNSEWATIENKVRSTRLFEQGGGKASVLLEELRLRRWKTVYWTRNVLREDDVFTFAQVYETYKVPPKAKKDYVNIDAIWREENLSDNELIMRVPFAVGFVSTGVHAFMQVGFTVYEAHWLRGPMRKLNDPPVISVGHFSELSPYFHGVIVIPEVEQRG